MKGKYTIRDGHHKYILKEGEDGFSLPNYPQEKYILLIPPMDGFVLVKYCPPSNRDRYCVFHLCTSKRGDWCLNHTDYHCFSCNNLPADNVKFILRMAE
jgi:hypothetical protein